MDNKLFLFFLVALLGVGVLALAIGDCARDHESKKNREAVTARVERVEKQQRNHHDSLGWIGNWVRSVHAQDCDTLPSCNELDRKWLRGEYP